MNGTQGGNMKQSLLLFCFLLLILGCSKDEYVIGYTGSLTRDITEISLSGRDGVILAVEEINKAGGINKRKIKLLIRDDQDRPEIAKKVDKELVEEGAFAIIGHVSSTLTKAALEYMDSTDVLLLSTKSNSPIFLNKDDQLFCMLPSGKAMVETMIEGLTKGSQKPSLAIIYNGKNHSYTIPVSELLSKMYSEAGGKVVSLHPYDATTKGFRYEDIVKEAVKEKPEVIALITNAMDATFFARSLYDLKSNALLIGADATCNEEILAGSGEPTEGFITVRAYQSSDTNPKHRAFKENFHKRFGYKPSLDAMFSYSAIQIIAEALRKNPDEKALKKTLLSLGTFEGLSYPVSFNTYGDNEEPYTLLKLQQGKLVPYHGQ